MDLVRKTSFNIFASQGNQRDIMQQTTMSVVNRKMDQDIITALNTGTVNAGAAGVTASVGLVLRAKTILGNSGVPWDGNVYGVVTPAFEAYLMQTKEFSNAEYVNLKPIPAADPAWRDSPNAFRWFGVTWLVHPNLPGKGTATEKCFLFHKSSVGHAVNSGGIESPVGYDEEQSYSWARCSIFMGSAVLQNSGIVVMNHDGSALVAG
jgi:Phage capsid protein